MTDDVSDEQFDDAVEEAKAAVTTAAGSAMHTQPKENLVNWKTLAYRALKYSNDANAIKRGKIPRRVARRAYGKLSGRVARKLFR